MTKPESRRQLAIEVVGLVKRFGDHEAVSGLSFEVARGEILGLLGPNGAGKTTTVNVLSTLLVPDAGTIRVAGHDVREHPHRVRAAISLTGQFAAVDETLTGAENLRLFARLRGLSRPAAATRAVELLGMFGLTDADDRSVTTYSGGMRRRLDLAASLVTQPEVLFLDEPTTGLDPRSRAELWAIVRALHDDGVTIVLTTQYLEEADQLADRIVLIDHGRSIAEGTPTELKRRFGDTTCVVSIVDGGQLDLAARAIKAAVDDRDVVVDAQLGQLTLAAPDGVMTLTTAIAALEQHSVAVHDVGLRRPTLDEVYLSLTGSAAS